MRGARGRGRGGTRGGGFEGVVAEEAPRERPPPPLPFLQTRLDTRPSPRRSPPPRATGSVPGEATGPPWEGARHTPSRRQGGGGAGRGGGAGGGSHPRGGLVVRAGHAPPLPGRGCAPRPRPRPRPPPVFPLLLREGGWPGREGGRQSLILLGGDANQPGDEPRRGSSPLRGVRGAAPAARTFSRTALPPPPPRLPPRPACPAASRARVRAEGALRHAALRGCGTRSPRVAPAGVSAAVLTSYCYPRPACTGEYPGAGRARGCHRR